jgi:hypothetical protein
MSLDQAYGGDLNLLSVPSHMSLAFDDDIATIVATAKEAPMKMSGDKGGQPKAALVC